MDENKKRIEKIYSRDRIKIPKINLFIKSRKSKRDNSTKIQKIVKVCVVILIAFLIVEGVMQAIEPVVDKQCISMARSIATKISNKQATIVMSDYKYEDLMNVSKDEQGNVKMVSSNMITVNKIISDVPILIQNELEKVENNRFYIKLGTFSGNKLLSGRGPNIEIKMSAIGNIETDLKSEFTEAGINQTLHRVYLEVKCNVAILTPFNSIEEQIVNQVLLAEGIIVGNIPDTYYNLNGMGQDNLVDVME